MRLPIDGRQAEPPRLLCVSTEIYFLGAVGADQLAAPRRPREPIYLLDRGLTDDQRELLEAEVTLVDAPDGRALLLKTVAPLAHPAEVMVLIDADMVVTRPLAS